MRAGFNGCGRLQCYFSHFEILCCIEWEKMDVFIKIIIGLDNHYIAFAEYPFISVWNI